MVCTGSKSSSQVRTVIEKVIKLIEEAGIFVDKEPEIVVQNIVGTANLGEKLNLNSIAMALGLERVEYEPEQFPGLVYRMFEPKVVLLIFGSGKIVCTGGKTPQDVESAVKKIKEELRATGQMQ